MKKYRFNKICVFGATSSIAQELIRLLGCKEASFFLFGRDIKKLEVVKDDIATRSSSNVFISEFDAMDFALHKSYVDKCISTLGGIDLCLFAYGWLPNQKELEFNSNLIYENYVVNSSSIISIASHVVNYFERQGNGTLAIFSSVAGDRGRRSNYFYGSAKASLDVFLEGLRHRLASSGISIITIKPGIVDTPMTGHLEKNLLFSRPDSVAKNIYYGLLANKPIIYSPHYWKFIMMFIRLLPRFLYYRLDI